MILQDCGCFRSTPIFFATDEFIGAVKVGPAEKLEEIFYMLCCLVDGHRFIFNHVILVSVYALLMKNLWNGKSIAVGKNI